MGGRDLDGEDWVFGRDLDDAVVDDAGGTKGLVGWIGGSGVVVK